MRIQAQVLRWSLGVAALVLFLAACSSGTIDTATDTVPPETVPVETVPVETVPTEPAPTTAPSAPTTNAPVLTETPQSTIAPDVVHPGYADDFGESIVPIFANRCAACHNAGGPGSVHWALEDVDDIASDAIGLNAVIAGGAMPPWPASNLSVAFHNERGLTPEEFTALADWSAAGSPVDVAGDTPVEADESLGLTRVDETMTPEEPYDGSPALVDDYRCLLYEPNIDAPAWIEGYDFVPDQTEVVHHAIGYLVRASERAAATELAAEDSGGGWECYGGSRLDDEQIFIAWAPGQGATMYPENSGLRIEPGDFFVLQLHYHFEIDAPADSSTLEMTYGDGEADYDEIRIAEYLGPAEIPCTTEESGPLCDRDAAMIAAVDTYGGEGVLANLINLICGVSPDDFADMTSGIASSTCDSPVAETGEIVSVFGHEHELGRSFRMTLNPDTPDALILLDIPEWSFDWQYNYYPVESIVLKGGDIIRLECEWDRSLRDPSLESKYIFWADGTNDEMCFSNIITRPSS